MPRDETADLGGRSHGFRVRCIGSGCMFGLQSLEVGRTYALGNRICKYSTIGIAVQSTMAGTGCHNQKHVSSKVRSCESDEPSLPSDPSGWRVVSVGWICKDKAWDKEDICLVDLKAIR